MNNDRDSYTLTIVSGPQRLDIDCEDLDAAITTAQRALTELGEHTADDYMAVCNLEHAPADLSNGAMIALTIDSPDLPKLAPVDVLPCPRCGQLAAGDGTVCQPCRELERTPQGQTVRLFNPAPTVPAGSLTFF